MEIIQEIGITVDMSKGSFNNTEYKNGSLQLVQLMSDGDGNPIYSSYGYWESENIIIQDKIKAFKNVVKTISSQVGSTYKISVRTSDGDTWSKYIEVASDGSIENVPDKYAMIKIEITAGKADSNLYFDKFDSDKYQNEYLNDSNGVLELKKNYSYTMDKKSVSLVGGNIFTKAISKSKFKKIDGIKIQ